MGLVAPQDVGSSRTRARTHVPSIGRRIPNHCATREVPIFSLSEWQSVTFILCLSCPCVLEVITCFLVSQVERNFNFAPWCIIPMVSPIPDLDNLNDEILDLSWSWKLWGMLGCGECLWHVWDGRESLRDLQKIMYFILFFNKFIYLFIFGCSGSLLLCTGFL